MGFYVKFWGVRGSIACPSPNHVVYGGNTSCIQVDVGGNHFVLDAGTGIRGLGHHFMKSGVENAVLLLSHTHWDHINGFPFFAPIFQKNKHVDIYAGHMKGKGGIKRIFASHMDNPTFPIPLDALQADLNFIDFYAGETLSFPGGVTVRTALLNHPNGATAYRFEHEGHSVCYVTDTEHVPGKPDQTILALIEGADLVIYDCTYTDDEFPQKVGWGHSTWQEGMRLCQQAQVKHMAIFHHDPDHDDEFMSHLENEARNTWDRLLVARDNMELTL